VLILCRRAKVTHGTHRGHAGTRDTVCAVLTDPETPEARLGQLVRAARKRLRLNLREGAKLVGLSTETLGYIERARNNRGGVYQTSDADLARCAAQFRIPAAELEKIGRDGAARLLESLPAAEPPIVSAADLEAAFDGVLDAILKRAERSPIPPSEAETVWFLWHDLDADSRRKPPAERVRSIANWLGKRDAERKPAEKDIHAV